MAHNSYVEVRRTLLMTEQSDGIQIFNMKTLNKQVARSSETAEVMIASVVTSYNRKTVCVV